MFAKNKPENPRAKRQVLRLRSSLRSADIRNEFCVARSTKNVYKTFCQPWKAAHRYLLRVPLFRFHQGRGVAQIPVSIEESPPPLSIQAEGKKLKLDFCTFPTQCKSEKTAENQGFGDSQEIRAEVLC